MITAIIKNVIFRRQMGRQKIAMPEPKANHDVGRIAGHARTVVAITIGRGTWLLGVKTPAPFNAQTMH